MYSVHWSSKVSFRYKKIAINSELHRAKEISSNFKSETARIKAKFLKAGFPHKVKTLSMISIMLTKNL